MLVDAETAKAEFATGGETVMTNRNAFGGCPRCGAPMQKQEARRPPRYVRVRLICSADEGHNEERYGYYEETL